MNRRLLMQRLLAPLWLAGAAAPALAQTWPARAVRVLEPNAPGSATDATLRALAPAMQATWAQPVVVDNRPGASGNIVMETLLASPSDGHTPAHATNNMLTANPHLMGGARPVPLGDVVVAAPLSNVGLVLVVRQDSPWKSLGDLLDDARRQPGRLSSGTPGVATPMHCWSSWSSSRPGPTCCMCPTRAGR